MSDVFDLTTIIFLAIAVVFILRLWRALGQRTGEERPPYDPYSPGDAANDDKVVTLPGVRKSEAPSAYSPVLVDEGAGPDWGKIAPQGSPLAEGLTAILNRDPSFDPEQFLEGAGVAYEMIVTAFADGDRSQLKSLLIPAVYDGFSSVIAEREARDETVAATFVGIDDATIVEAGVKGSSARITVKFRSKLISATLDGNGKVTEGDSKKVREVTDIWTFERNLGSRDPNWRLAATEAAN
ncbi:Tim44-like domain protein [hydrothermal vent metagenome]|uniref:Tim44-like domain protein n=1 Tax=hydrothermal vent metagenome TaxID=652676 RepID=A0A3B0SX26_9ZZZZ